MAAGVW
jgi:hypothetical protein